MQNEIDASPGVKARLFTFMAGVAALVITNVVPPPWANLSTAGWQTMGLVTLMGIWWVAETLPIAVTSLLPLLLVPLLGLAKIDAAAAPYADPLIYLYMGGFILGLAIEKWSLHARIALHVLKRTGTAPARQIGGMMLVTAFLSMWMSNTATTVLMLPIALSIISLQGEDARAGLAPAMMLAVAYAASSGGISTLIGTPPNAFLKGFLAQNYNLEISFAGWMMMALPLALVMLAFVYLWLTRVAYHLPSAPLPRLRAMIEERLAHLGPMQAGEKVVAIIFALAALLWMTRPLVVRWTGLPISDTSIAILVTVLLFIVPVDLKTLTPAMDWKTAQKTPWGILLLFGGGLSLAAQVEQSGLASFIGTNLLSSSDMPLLVMILLTTTVVIFLTEITSNIAVTAIFIPVLAPISVSLGHSPLMLTVPAALAASCAFMMPVATPPNAIVFSSGHLRIRDMCRAGFALNIAGIVIITVAVESLMQWAFRH